MTTWPRRLTRLRRKKKLPSNLADPQPAAEEGAAEEEGQPAYPFFFFRRSEGRSGG